MTLKEVLSVINLKDLCLVQDKHGVQVYKGKQEGKNVYIKHFRQGVNVGEIKCYEVLSNNGIIVIPFKRLSQDTILFRDMEVHSKYRLGEEEDFFNLKVITSIARWFKHLHTLSTKKQDEFTFLESERVQFSTKELDSLILKYNDSEVLHRIKENIIVMNHYLLNCELVLIHDDFYYKNFFVNDLSEVMLFDFNYMKLGLASQELSLIRRNLRSASTESEEHFVSEYGEYNKLEYQVYELYRHINCLYVAHSMDKFPSWADESKQFLLSGKITELTKSVLTEMN